MQITFLIDTSPFTLFSSGSARTGSEDTKSWSECSASTQYTKYTQLNPCNHKPCDSRSILLLTINLLKLSRFTLAIVPRNLSSYVIRWLVFIIRTHCAASYDFRAGRDFPWLNEPNSCPACSDPGDAQQSCRQPSFARSFSRISDHIDFSFLEIFLG